MDKSASKPTLTDMEDCVLRALGNKFQRPRYIAERAGIATTSPAETAAKYCIRLVKKGYAERDGSRMFPRWRRAMEEG